MARQTTVARESKRLLRIDSGIVDSYPGIVNITE